MWFYLFTLDEGSGSEDGETDYDSDERDVFEQKAKQVRVCHSSQQPTTSSAPQHYGELKESQGTVF